MVGTTARVRLRFATYSLRKARNKLRDLTFDMSGRQRHRRCWQSAQPQLAVGCPLDDADMRHVTQAYVFADAHGYRWLCQWSRHPLETKARR